MHAHCSTLNMPLSHDTRYPQYYNTKYQYYKYRRFSLFSFTCVRLLANKGPHCIAGVVSTRILTDLLAAFHAFARPRPGLHTPSVREWGTNRHPIRPVRHHISLLVANWCRAEMILILLSYRHHDHKHTSPVMADKTATNPPLRALISLSAEGVSLCVKTSVGQHASGVHRLSYNNLILISS